jgi:hypothetical protein
MESAVAELDPTELTADPRPSEDFLRAVAEFFETDAEDLLVELGYVPDEAVVAQIPA